MVTITSARRISELGALSAREDFCAFHPNTVVLRLDSTFILKINLYFHRAQEIVLPDFVPIPLMIGRNLGINWMCGGPSIFTSSRQRPPGGRKRYLSRSSLLQWVLGCHLPPLGALWACIVQAYEALCLRVCNTTFD